VISVGIMKDPGPYGLVPLLHRLFCAGTHLAVLTVGILLGSPALSAQVNVVCTTSMVADLVREIGGGKVRVASLMGPGVDPHLYKATAADVTRLQSAQIIFYNGLMLEGKMQDVLVRLGKANKPVYAVTEALDRKLLLSPEGFDGHPDPHVWFDLTLWMGCSETVVKGLSAVLPDSKAYFLQRASAWRSRMQKLHEFVLTKTAELPVGRRILVTSHDAYNYFGRAYGFRVVGLQGISTVTEAGLADMSRLVDFIKSQGIKAIFVESSVPHQTIERISRDAGVKVGGEIFSDAMGTPGVMENGVDLGTYEGMIKHNIITIVEGLK